MVRYDKSAAEQGERYVRDQRRAGGLGGRNVAIGGGGLGLVLAIVGMLLGVDLTGGGGGFTIDNSGFGADAGPVDASGADDTVDPDADTVEYLQFLMFDIQDTWSEYFDSAGMTYTETSLVVFTDAVSTGGCGRATSAVGPFYCPAPNDRTVYIDLDFFDDLASDRFGAAGDFAQAYVIAHEIGHHIQSITGISESVQRAQQEDQGNANEYSVRQELQADCFAGVWAYSANQRLTTEGGLPIIEQGDIDEGLTAAASVGDDRIQAQSGGGINPDTWTHGSSDQRVRWFQRGFTSGDPEQCDTFAAEDL